jgi:hypothetical protein
MFDNKLSKSFGLDESLSHMHDHDHHHHHDGVGLDRLVFCPKNRIYRTWFTVRVMLVVASVYISPYQAAFRSYSGQKLRSATDAFEIFFLIDIILNFFKEYENEYDKDHCYTNFKEIAINYFKNDFVWNLIPLLPFQLLKLPQD